MQLYSQYIFVPDKLGLLFNEGHADILAAQALQSLLRTGCSSAMSLTQPGRVQCILQAGPGIPNFPISPSRLTLLRKPDPRS